MSDRDDLARIIDPNAFTLGDMLAIQDQRNAARQADKILAAGWTRNRTVTTVEELDALSNASVILDQRGIPCIKAARFWQFGFEKRLVRYPDLTNGPFVVLFQPVP